MLLHDPDELLVRGENVTAPAGHPLAELTAATQGRSVRDACAWPDSRDGIKGGRSTGKLRASWSQTPCFSLPPEDRLLWVGTSATAQVAVLCRTVSLVVSRQK